MGRFGARALSMFAGVLLLGGPTKAAVVLDFEGQQDSTVLTNQYPGFSFVNAIILKSGISLNEFEFPPHSGANVVSDNGGPMTITFNPAVQSFSGYFTYSEPLTVAAFDSAHSLVATATSHFSNNEALSGDQGSSPNEVLSVSSNGGISSITITGDPGGSSFALDDVTVNTGSSPNPTPLPPTVLLTLVGLGLVMLFMARRKTRTNLIGTMVAVLGIFVLVESGAIWLSGAPQASRPSGVLAPRIRIVSVKPVAASAKVTVTAQISHPTYIQNSSNLIGISTSGLRALLGRMHDEKGTSVIQVPLGDSPSQLQVSAAFRGRVRRVLSDPKPLKR